MPNKKLYLLILKNELDYFPIDNLCENKFDFDYPNICQSFKGLTTITIKNILF